MIQSLLIANRGEIACRIIRTARKMGIRTVAVYSDADAKALHVRMADEAVHIGPSAARESYLVGDKIIAAAKATGAEAIHPGYGFLSENAEFAQSVIDAALVWVGPKPASITAMGLKDAAKKLMADAGVPVTPGYMGDNQDPAYLAEEAAGIGYPVLIKAVAGGGGKGMRKVDRAEDFADALESCQREAASSFGNNVVLIEKWIESPRHIEVQVFGDSHGNVVHLFERDCSLQRRHQKVIEEAPAPGMDEATREAVCGAAVRAAQAVNYEGAGTIEFIADASEGLRADRIWFMEMNTRLQVEHPVTEEITGQDLVEWQLRVASGEPLPLTQDELSINGHAIEARLYAEDPAKGFLPSTGRLEHFNLGGDGRIETGVEEGDEISPFYDPMIAKLVAKGADRDEAIESLGEVLSGVFVFPVRTNASFLLNALGSEEFRSAVLDTGFIGRHEDELVSSTPPSARTLSDALLWAARASTGYDPKMPFLAGFRMNAQPQAHQHMAVNGRVEEFEFKATAPGDRFEYGFREDSEPDSQFVVIKGQTYRISWPRFSATVGGGAHDGDIIAPMPGKVTSVEVAAGDKVMKGQRLLTLEAMKMEHGLTAPFDGTVAELNASAGAQVAVDSVLARIQAEA
ncbi:acetyl/propionyl/methylcrotonyl-CoA carboxylase subunit alpha [Sphingomonas jaspsi]|uniref:acetyl/propionyl/methylcrotonyl-CoA carboxylase subunit alpha n=1 Tax=Sphingomonas jaspsi TaxID=392409 RepID=UPI0004B3A138|nr:acetyl/propionyl/methylcrotonyl-CoA carboxylase subunit alpha [Sphingomonas jaspsi]